MAAFANPDRRTVLALLIAAPLCGLARPAGAQAPDGGAVPAGVRFRAIAVDTSAIADHGGGGLASALRDLLEPQLQKVFADLMAPGDRRAPILMARIGSVFLADYVGGMGIDQFGQQDNIEGDGVVLSGGQPLSTTHVLTELSPSYSGAYYTQGIDRTRLDSLAYQFAYWLRREMKV